MLGKSTDNINQILGPGDYYIHVLPGLASDQTSYVLSIAETSLSSVVRLGSDNINIWNYNSNGRTNEGIDPNKETVTIIHGWNNSDESDSIQKLVREATRSGLQVLALDWGSIANGAKLDSLVSAPFNTAKWIGSVAKWTQGQLAGLGLSANRLTLIGHSLGAYVSDEIGSLFGKVKNFVALDPAYPANSYDIYGTGEQHPKDFRDVANTSIAFVVSDNAAGLFGDNDKAGTANASFLMKFDPGERGIVNAIDTHGAVIDAFTNALSRGLITLPNLTLPNYINNWYQNDGYKDDFLDRIFNPGLHEGVISSTWTNKELRITGFTRVVDSSGREETTWS